MALFSLMSNDIGVDLGTASILVYIKGRGVVLREPSVIAVDRDNGSIVAYGEDARLMLGRTPGNLKAVRPLRQGVISDYTLTEKMLKHFIDKAVGVRTLRKPRVAVCIPSGATEVEKKAVEDATYQAGAREVTIIEEPVAAAIGAGIDISKPYGNIVVDIGGGTSDIAVISLGGTVVSESVKVAGDDFDEAIIRYMRKKHNLLINVIGNTLGLLITGVFAYTYLFTTGVSFPAWASAWDRVAQVFPFMLYTLATIIISRRCFEKTGSIWTGAFVNSFIVTMMLVTNTSNFYLLG